MPVTKVEFERAIHRGLGRAVLWLKRGEIVPDRDFLLYACTHNLAYDRQVEDNRALYIFDVIQATGEPEFYVQALQRTLAEWDESQEEADNEENDTGLPVSIGQIFDLLALAASGGDLAAKQSLYTFFAEHAAAESTLYSADALVAMDGLEGYLFAVRQWIRNPPQESDQWYEASLLEDVEEQFGVEEVQAFLTQAALTEPAISAYLARVRAERAAQAEERKQRPKPVKPTYADLRQTIFDTDKRLNRPHLWRWGEKMSNADAEQFASELLAETDSKRLARYLHLFHRRAFPLDLVLLLALAQSTDEAISSTARAALVQIEHPSVRALALEVLDTSLRPWELIEMLTRNFCPGDEEAIERILNRTWDADEMHRLTIDVNHLIEANPQGAFSGALMRLYEEGWCTFCRERVIEKLTGFGPLPTNIVEEGHFDADKATRKLVQQTMSGNGAA